MIKNVLSGLALSLCFFTLAQTTKADLNNQISFCRQEVSKLETQVNKYEGLMEVQHAEVKSLKDTILIRDSKIHHLESKIVDLESAAVILLDVARSLEEQDKELEALKIYKLIKEIYPGTLDSSSATFRIRKIHKDLRSKPQATK
jgi:TolA-binding protein